MILVDTSVWIDYFNGVDNLHTTTLDLKLIEGTVAIGDIIFLEILQGFRKDSDYKKTKTRLSTLEQYEMFGHRMVNNCAENYRSLRKKGITIRSTTDIIIATFCIENKLPLLFKDKDFIPFVDHLNLLPTSLKT
ncbi:MAG: PIN domain nuclease [Methylococcales symbiont of Hymedesmia sp. n. MRB-2018]|nr:MAG: PIN domain nuclease [Methylococcales symbiont of Hymedesmia sp. n. MRB-2018]KAF3984249.1 MAG: PIN domain nuclease [Methylococcales symbiont of Hymedesmia sp. n. MRB-2018]